MRVIAGKYKRRVLLAPTGIQTTRPTGDRVKESLFNIIHSSIEGARVLDLFSGSGALGIEALSRGAKFVTFVENDPLALTALRFNLTQLQIEKSHFCIVSADANKFLKNPEHCFPLASGNVHFAASMELVLADPPYDSPWYHTAIDMLENSKLCSTNCVAVFEMGSHFSIPSPETQLWQQYNERKYGVTRLEFWERQDKGRET